MKVTQLKAIVAGIIAVLAAFGDTLATTNGNVNWRTIVTAVIAFVVAHQGVFWTPRVAKYTTAQKQSGIK